MSYIYEFMIIIKNIKYADVPLYIYISIKESVLFRDHTVEKHRLVFIIILVLYSYYNIICSGILIYYNLPILLLLNDI